MAPTILRLDHLVLTVANLETTLNFYKAALRFGANDAGSIAEATEEDIRRIIRGAGLKPVERDAAYTTHFLA